MEHPEDSPTPPDGALAERGRLLVAEAAASVYAPASLRERLDLARPPARPVRRRPRWQLLTPAVGVLAAAVIAVVLATGGGAAPSVFAAAQLGSRGALVSAPADDPARPGFLREKVDDVTFPDWNDQFAWRTTGARSDQLDGRATKTVFYAADDVEAAYTIVDGDALELPSDGQRRERNGIKLWVYDEAGRRVVVWERSGHTCVLSAPASVPAQRMVQLAAWEAA